MTVEEYLAGEELALALLRRHPELTPPTSGTQLRRVYPVVSVEAALLWANAMNTLPRLEHVDAHTIELAGWLRGLKVLVALRRTNVAVRIEVAGREQWLLPKQIHDVIADPPEHVMAAAPWMEEQA
ncbi:hypothetical protein [Nonomuraea typhae]|uniref:hypothetical protein n=1 Tax=Nonomuraea typhae TaxID=2603600 RepID=UPI0012F83CC0|nr:hypothetical protein [Nonomuraea typhae]